MIPWYVAVLAVIVLFMLSQWGKCSRERVQMPAPTFWLLVCLCAALAVLATAGWTR